MMHCLLVRRFLGFSPPLFLVFVAALSGCAGESTRPAGPLRMPGDDARLWRPDPVAARIYPATRFVKEGDRSFLQLGIELLDGLGDSVKGVGMVRAQLLTAPSDGVRSGLRGPQSPMSGSGPTAPGVQLYGWDARLATREEQEAHWDPVSRSYFFELTLDGFDVASRPCRVRISFEPPDGPPIVAEAVMQTLP